MRLSISRAIRLLGLLAVLLSAPLPVAAQDVMALVRADRWEEAAAAVAGHPDPVARKLVHYFRLLAPGAGEAGEIGRFMAGNPDWPLPGLLARRRDEALAIAPDGPGLAAECRRAVPGSTAALLRCADALGGGAGEARAMLKAAWAQAPGEVGWEARFLARWAPLLDRRDHEARFERLLWTDPAAARRQADRLDGASRSVADAVAALRRDDPAAGALVSALPASRRATPALMLEHARWLRRADRDDEAVAVWRASGNAAEQAAPAARRSAFWDERNLMARRRLRQGDAAGAYALAAGHAQPPGEARLDAEFLAGFIALRRQDDRAAAERHFRTLAAESASAITQGRALYWLGRASASPAAARADFARAAAWTTTFYGQLAAVALGDDPAALTRRVAGTLDPPADAQRAQDFSSRELARAAALLVAWGEPRRATPFLLQLHDISPDPADRALVARLAAGLGLQPAAVAVARRAGREGVMLAEAGWPTTPTPVGAVEPALAMAVIRQESNFDPLAVSHAGARGLMQLMPGTAAQVARSLGVAAPLAALTRDPDLNMQLGTTYLRGLLDRFDANVAMAAAGYNAGPHRVAQWLALNGDPRAGEADIVDWIELIPFSETRNYVQRVVENMVIYRARQGEVQPHPLAQWLR